MVLLLLGGPGDDDALHVRDGHAGLSGDLGELPTGVVRLADRCVSGRPVVLGDLSGRTDGGSETA
jgi:hypothetical protein